MYCEITQGIRIEVVPNYIPEESKPELGYYFFAYRVKITNESAESVQLMSRHWLITDGHGKVHEVQGPGVVGQQPLLVPGESFEYSSFCPLPTPTGNMRGTYRMMRVHKNGGLDQVEVDVKIPLFFLRDLRTVH